MTTTEERLEALEKRLADAEAEANNAMVQSLDNEKTILSLRFEVRELREKLEALASKTGPRDEGSKLEVSQ